MTSYDPIRVAAVVQELEDNAGLLGYGDQRNIAMAREYIDTDTEVPRWLLVKLSMVMQKLRS